jgi:exodeoxyribonuclease V beta subunit
MTNEKTGPAPPALLKLNPLALPLRGIQVIEASAGTGKTWTLAALYVRLVLGHAPPGRKPAAGLYPPQILVMTFTDAATAELRGRIRERLSQAAAFFLRSGQGKPDGDEADDFLRALRSDLDADQWPACAHRLDMAAQWMDDAAIFTIHGWSSRMLKAHAFDSASLFQQSRVEDGDRLKLMAVQDYWRKWFYPLSTEQLGALQAIGQTPEDLFQKLRQLWAVEDQAPHQEGKPPLAPDVVIRDWELWQARFLDLEGPAQAACTQAIIGLLAETIAAKKLKSYRADWPGKLADWAQGESIALMARKDRTATQALLQRFSLGTLLALGWRDACDHAAFADIERLSDHLSLEPQVGDVLLAHAASEIGAAYRKAKASLAQFDFSDLLQHLYHALQAPDGRLAAAIRQEFPVALVDEFQDTDPWQYGALSRIYGPASVDSPAQQDTALILIGDPKQAIYSFRGADLNTYLTARHQAQAIHTLSGNFRSTADMVAAVNHVFTEADKPFGEVPFEPVVACNPKVLPLRVGGQVQTAMTVWHLQRAKPQRKDVFVRDMAALFATQMVALLNQGAARPGDMAVLVREGSQARAIRNALAHRGVRSVYLSERDSVFATPQAIDLWRILRAVATPRASPLVRAALATSLWGLSWAALEALFQDESAWDDLTDRFHGWQTLWQRQGFLPMLHHLLHDQSIPARLLSQSNGQNRHGERQLTNLLHLGDLLQTASLGLQGEGALVRYLEDQLRRPQATGDMAQLRLESDANLVQVITLHKAKGLQYPLVFLPFVSGYRAETSASGKDDGLRLEEDIRLLYVALTRAEQALWVGVAQTKGDVDGKTPKVKNAVSRLLGRQTSGDLATRLRRWEMKHIVIENAPEPNDTPCTTEAPGARWKPALTPRRTLISRWWSASFSSLAREVSHRTAPGAATGSERDERLSDAQIDSTPVVEEDGSAPGSHAPAALAHDLALPFNDFEAGSAYGTLVHDLLEWQAQNGWPAGQGEANAVLVRQWQALVARKAQRLKLDEAQQGLLLTWIQAIATAPLVWATAASPKIAIQLACTNHLNTWAEMAFSLKVQQLESMQLDTLIAQHVLVGQARTALHPRQMEGMLTGFMDLVLEVDGRYYVMDYKSNKLPCYDAIHLQQAILAHRYDVQYTLYLLALHRLLKSRLPDYDYERHMGGALYLFLRGIDQPGAGLYADRPPHRLIEALDAAFCAPPVLLDTQGVRA